MVNRSLCKFIRYHTSHGRLVGSIFGLYCDIYIYMEKRKLQKTGGASLTLTLPKKWVLSHKLVDKDSVMVSLQKSGALVVQPTFLTETPSRSRIDLGGLSGKMLHRELLAHYLSGVDEIIIKGSSITPEQRKNIRLFVQSLIGFELVGESSEEIVLKNIFDISKFPIQQNIEKMFQIARSMLDDALISLNNNDRVLAQDIVDRDFEIDNLNITITRQFHSLIRDLLSEEETNLNSFDLNYYNNIGTQLERIADHAVKIAKAIISEEDKKVSENLIALYSTVFKKIITALEQSKQMVACLDKGLAHKILDMNAEIEKTIYQSRNKGGDIPTLWIITIDSFDRIRGYVMNMAEMTIDQSVSKEKFNT